MSYIPDLAVETVGTWRRPCPWFRGRIWVGMLLLAVVGMLRGEPLQKLPNCLLVTTEWSDGDSFLIRSPDKQEFTARLYGVDCVEWHIDDATDERRLREQRRYFGITNARPTASGSIEVAKGFGAKAATEVNGLLAKPFTVYTTFADARGDGRHKRVYVFVICADGNDLGATLVSKGLARAFGVARQTWDGRTQNDYREYLADLELQAAKRAAGIWASTDWENLPNERQQQRRENQETELAFDNQPLADGKKLDPNTAARDDLMKLPGIGEMMANRMIENRPYGKSDDLLKVPGIGPATLQKILPHLEISRGQTLR
jgi:DNA uptake protein ComE-like DNA-binding protein